MKDSNGNEIDKDQLETPQWLFNILDEKFKFDVDLCASEENKKCRLYCSNIFEEPAYAVDSVRNNYVVRSFKNKCYKIESAFMNPPYSNPLPFIKRALELKFKTLVMVLPVDTSTKWWNYLICHTHPYHNFACMLNETNVEILNIALSPCNYGFKETSQIIYMPQRVKFEYQGKPTKSGGQRPTCVVIIKR